MFFLLDAAVTSWLLQTVLRSKMLLQGQGLGYILSQTNPLLRHSILHSTEAQANNSCWHEWRQEGGHDHSKLAYTNAPFDGAGVEVQGGL